MFTTLGPALLTASTTGVRRGAATPLDGAEFITIATPRTTAIQYRSPRQRSQGRGTVVVPTCQEVVFAHPFRCERSRHQLRECRISPPLHPAGKNPGGRVLIRVHGSRRLIPDLL